MCIEVITRMHHFIGFRKYLFAFLLGVCAEILFISRTICVDIVRDIHKHYQLIFAVLCLTMYLTN